MMRRRGVVLLVVVCVVVAGLGVLGWSVVQGRAGRAPAAAAAGDGGGAGATATATAPVAAQDFAFVLVRSGEVSVLADGSVGVPLVLTPQEVFLLRRQQAAGRWRVTTPLGVIAGDCRSVGSAPSASAVVPSAAPADASADPSPSASASPSPSASSAGDVGSGVAPVVCAVAPADAGQLVAGLPAEVRLEGPVVPGALVVPVSAVWWQGAQPFVTVRSGSGDAPVAVDLGPSDGAAVVLRSGPAVGEQVLLAPLAQGPGGLQGPGAG